MRELRLEEGALVFDATAVYRKNFVRYRNETSMEPRQTPKLLMLKGYAFLLMVFAKCISVGGFAFTQIMLARK